MLVEEELLLILDTMRMELGREFAVAQREAEILFYVIQGKTNSEVGIMLGIAERTVKKHLENTFPKLGIENRHAAPSFVADFFRRLR